MNEPAFPQKEPLTSDHPGMSLRDYFAAKAMQGLLGHYLANKEHLAVQAYAIADAMLKQREAK